MVARLYMSECSDRAQRAANTSAFGHAAGVIILSLPEGFIS